MISVATHNALLAILRIGILRCRIFAEPETVARCHAEANHVHNIPTILLQGNDGALSYYMNVEVPIYLTNSQAADEAGDFEIYWNIIRAEMNSRKI